MAFRKRYSDAPIPDGEKKTTQEWNECKAALLAAVIASGVHKTLAEYMTANSLPIRFVVPCLSQIASQTIKAGLEASATPTERDIARKTGTDILAVMAITRANVAATAEPVKVKARKVKARK